MPSGSDSVLIPLVCLADLICALLVVLCELFLLGLFDMGKSSISSDVFNDYLSISLAALLFFTFRVFFLNTFRIWGL